MAGRKRKTREEREAAAEELGVPTKEIKWDEVDKLCAIFATKQEIADFFGLTPYEFDCRLLEEKGMQFSDYFTIKSARGKLSLRRAQMQAALGGNVTMQRFLGIQHLGQSDNPIDQEGNIPLPWVDDEAPPAAVRAEQGDGPEEAA